MPDVLNIVKQNFCKSSPKELSQSSVAECSKGPTVCNTKGFSSAALQPALAAPQSFT